MWRALFHRDRDDQPDSSAHYAAVFGALRRNGSGVAGQESASISRFAWLIAHGDRFVLGAVSLYLMVACMIWGASVWLVMVNAIGLVIALGTIQRTFPHSLRMLTSLLSLLLLVLTCVVIPREIVNLVAWFPIIGVSVPLVIGLRRSYPLLIAIAVAYGFCTVHLYGWTIGLLRVPFLLGGVFAGLIADALDNARDAERKARQRQDELAAVIDAVPVGIVLISADADAGTNYANKSVLAYTEAAVEEFKAGELRKFVHPDDHHMLNQIRHDLTRGSSMGYEIRLLHPTDGTRRCNVIGAPVKDRNGGITGGVLVIQDVHQSQILNRNLERFRAVAENTSDLILLISLIDDLHYLNPAGKAFFGAESLSSTDAIAFVPLEHRELTVQQGFIDVVNKGSWSGEVELFDRNGDRYPMSEVAVAVRDDDNNMVAVAVSYRNISAFKALEQQLEHEASHDALTALPNRQALFEHLEQRLLLGHSTALMFCDLDDFKVINDSLGHAVGDAILRVIAQRLRASVRADDVVGRLGGDEFLVICSATQEADSVSAAAERLAFAVREPILLNGRSHVVTMSIGVAIAQEADTSNDLVQRADLAMYAAKRSGRRKVSFFHPSMRERADARLEMERDLRVAFEHNQFEMHYQPIVHTEDLAVLGFEALVRWNHPVNGLMPPARFLPTIEEAGFAAQLGDVVLAEAIAAAATLNLARPGITVSINLSPAQLADPRLVDKVAVAITRADISASVLTFEITEDVVMSDLLDAQPKLQSLRDLGVRLAIDDFGTGYSNLSMLHGFHADYVKVDRSLTSGLGSTAAETQFVELILRITDELGFGSIAEGVETQQQLDELRRMDCRMAQGYLFAKPMPLAQAVRYASNGTITLPPLQHMDEPRGGKPVGLL